MIHENGNLSSNYTIMNILHPDGTNMMNVTARTLHGFFVLSLCMRAAATQAIESRLKLPTVKSHLLQPHPLIPNDSELTEFVNANIHGNCPIPGRY